MDEKFIKENNLNEAIDRFQELANYEYPKQSLKHLYEYTFISAPLIGEDGEENDGELQQSMGQNQDQNVMPQNNATENPSQMDGMNGQPDDEMSPDAAEMPQNGNIRVDAPMDANVPQNDNMMGNDMGAEMPDEGIETTEMEPDDEVIDVDELTQSQEATEYKVDGVDERLSQLYDVVQKFSEQLAKNAENIKALKVEFEKRNPTEEEKLNLRSQSSYPYSETPKGYWEEKAKQNPHYNVMYNNDVSPSDEQKEFEVTKDNIAGLDMKSIADTLDIDQNLKDYIGF